MFLKKQNNMYKGVEDGDKYTQRHIILGSQQHLHTRKQEYTTSESDTERQRTREANRDCVCVDLCKCLVQNKTETFE